MRRTGPHDTAEPADIHLEEATQWFMRVREAGRAEDVPAFKNWLDSDPLNANAYEQVAATWAAMGKFSSAPEVMMGRRDALDDAHRAARRRWTVRGRASRYVALAASLAIAVVGALTWFYSQQGLYATDLAERRVLTLEDGSILTLDAKSRVRVRYEQDQRLIWLERGQARFDVAKDPTRPFRVRAGDQTIIALGTQFNVELVAGHVLVSMIEGHVAVTGAAAQPVVATNIAVTPVELKAGEGLRVDTDGQAVMLPKIDVERATAWQAGKMFFDNEPLVSAAERINRYSQVQVVVDPSVAEVGVSGVFNAGDPDAFVEAIASYFPVYVERVSAAKIEMRAPAK